MMGNRGYSRFKDTCIDLNDCYGAMRYNNLISDEVQARRTLIKLCVAIARDFGDEVVDLKVLVPSLKSRKDVKLHAKEIDSLDENDCVTFWEMLGKIFLYDEDGGFERIGEAVFTYCPKMIKWLDDFSDKCEKEGV